MRSVELYRDNVRVFFQERRYLTGDRFAAVKAKRDEFDQLFFGVIRRGVEQGVFRSDIDTRIAGFGILGMCGWAHHWFEPSGRQTLGAGRRRLRRDGARRHPRPLTAVPATRRPSAWRGPQPGRAGNW